MVREEKENELCVDSWRSNATDYFPYGWVGLVNWLVAVHLGWSEAEYVPEQIVWLDE